MKTRLIPFLLMLMLSGFSYAEDIGNYVPVTSVQQIKNSNGTNATQLSAMYLHNGNIVMLANDGGRLKYRVDPTDHTNVLAENGNMNGCGDIEGGTQFRTNFNLYAYETTPARLFLMPPPTEARSCNDAIETVDLVGYDETKNSWGIEGVAIALNGDVLVVKETFPPRVGAFTWVTGVLEYTPVDLFSPEGCDRIGDIAVRPTTGNILLICKADKKVREYTYGGALVSVLPIPEFGQPEGLFDDGLRICITGEPDQYQCFVPSGTPPIDPPPPPPPVTEVCQVSGSVNSTNEVIDNNSNITVICETFSGTLDVSENIIAR